jgi:hypothetical protein
VAITVTSLVIYVGLALVFAVLDRNTLAQGIIIKVLIVVALIGAVQTAIVYERERNAERAERFAAEAEDYA